MNDLSRAPKRGIVAPRTAEQLSQVGTCLRASFACTDRDCPETRELLLRLFDVPAQGGRRQAS